MLSETTLRLNAVSDWSRNSAVIDAFGTFRKSLSGEEVSDFRGAAVGTFELDLTDEWTARAVLGYETAPETASSPVTIVGVLDEPIRQTVSGSLGIEKDAGKARLALTGRFENDTYGDAELVDGTELSQEDRNSTLATVTLRGGYEISPALVPFVEVEAGRDSTTGRRQRRFPPYRGHSGRARRRRARSRREAHRRDLGRLDQRDVRGRPPRAGRGTDIQRLAVLVAGAADQGRCRGVDHSGGFDRRQRKRVDPLCGRSPSSASCAPTSRPNLWLAAALRDYTGLDGRDVILGAEAGATYWFNRYLGLTGRLRHERLDSTLPDRDYTTNSAFLGLKLQR